MANLDQDLEKYASELYTKGDLSAGLKLAGEITGVIALGGFALTVLTSWMPAIGITLAAGTVVRIMTQLGLAYSRLSTKERKEVRAVVRWIKGGFSLGSSLAAD